MYEERLNCMNQSSSVFLCQGNTEKGTENSSS